MIRRLIAGAVASSLIAAVGVQKQSLTGPGAVGAVLTGTVTTGLGGYGRAALLVAFFVASSALSRLKDDRPIPVDRYTDRGAKRDIWQVAANGVIPTAIASLGSDRRHVLPYAGSLAAVTGDTWATEIGALSPVPPRNILTGEPVPSGTSGGISLYGTIASVAGGTFIGGMAALAGSFDPAFTKGKRSLLFTGVTSGVIGSLVDSLLGATVQERRWCDECRISTERRVHDCGTPTKVVGGIPGLDNDAVNLLCSLTGAGIGWMFERRAQRDVVVHS